MRSLIALIFALFLPLAVQAQVLPAAYSVTGVAGDDVLNIRMTPNGSAEIIGALGPYTVGVEVLTLTEDGKWGLVSAGEQNGWVAMRYLKILAPTGLGMVPRPMTCFGNEPFWALAMQLIGDEYELAGDGRRALNVLKEVSAYQGYAVVFEEGPTLNRTLTVTRGWCSDGMSDLEFGWRATLLNETPEGDSLLFGCCTLDHR